MTCQHTSTLGVYLLGALEPEERSTFESHLHGCDNCRAELVRLAPLPGLLNQITQADFEESTEPRAAALDPVPRLEPVPALELADAEEPQPEEPAEPDQPAVRRAWYHSRRWRLAVAAAAVVVLAVSGFFGYQVLRDEGYPGRTVTWSANDPTSGVRAQVQLTERTWGTDIKVWMSEVPGAKPCRLVVKAKEGYRDKTSPYAETAGWWTTAHRADDDIPGSTSIDLASINRLEIMDGERMLVGLNATAG